MIPEIRRVARPILLFGAASLVIAGSCQNNDNRYDIDMAKARALIDSDNPPLIIDVRTEKEYNGALGHIRGARLIPLNVLEDSLAVLNVYRDSTILTVCKIGYRSGIAAKELHDNGFKNVHNLAGGMVAWKKYESSAPR